MLSIIFCNLFAASLQSGCISLPVSISNCILYNNYISEQDRFKIELSILLT